ncbi:uncharacterized protein [Eurosta solidaginis]|uniref:uncharacterized protein n=1 Tax=Eurosta solidaginis TaxID=178769 RepID=UPI0035315889
MFKPTVTQDIAGVAKSAGDGVAEYGEIERAGVGGVTQSPGANIDSNTSFQANKVPENNNVPRSKSSRSTNPKYDRHDAGRYDHMSDDASSASSIEHFTTARRSRRMQLTDSNGYNGPMSDCSHCRKHRMGSKRRKSRSRSKRPKSRSRSRRRR